MIFRRPPRAASLVICFTVGLLEGFDIQVLGVAARALRQALGLDALALSWMFALSNIGIAIGASFGGGLADRLGRKPVFIAAVAIFGGFTLGTAFAGNLAQFATMRLLAGFGLGAGLTNMVAIASDLSEERSRGKVTTAMFCGVPLGGAAVAALAQSLALGTMWRSLFVIGGVVPLLLVAAIVIVLPETRAATTTSRSTLGFREALLGGGRAMSTGFIWLIFLLTAGALYLMLYWLPLLVASKGLSEAAASRSALTFNLAGIAGALILGRLVDRLPPRTVLATAYAILVLSGVLLVTASGPVLTLALSGASGFALLGITYGLYACVSRLYPSHAVGAGAGAAIGVGRIGSILGPLLPGLLPASHPAAVFWWIAAAAVCAALALLPLDLSSGTAPEHCQSKISPAVTGPG